MKQYIPIKNYICFILLMLCATNSSFAINSIAIEGKSHHYGSQGIDMANKPYGIKNRSLNAQIAREEKALIRSERLVKKLVQKTYKLKRPENSKQLGLFIMWTLLGVGMLLGAGLFVIISGILINEGEAGAGAILVIGGAIVCAVFFVLIFIKLLRWNKRVPKNSVSR